MAGLIVVLLGKLVIEIGRFIGRAMGEAKPQPICTDCMFAHIQYPSNRRLAISCTFGGGVRPMKLDVLYCSDYRKREARLPMRVLGFARESACCEPAIAGRDEQARE